MKDIKEALDIAKEYYKDKEVPTNVASYLKNYPKGLSRQVLDYKYGVKCSEFVNLLNPKYRKADAYETLLESCSRLDLELVDTTLTKDTFKSKNRVDVRCIKCGYVNNTTSDSLRGTVLGCRACKSGNLAWKDRVPELIEILAEYFDAELISEVPHNQTGYITLKHIPCGTEYTTQLLGIVSPNTPNRGTCPNCRDTDRRVTRDGITFGSEFEYSCYLKLKHLNPETHVLYSKYIDTDRGWVCDFKIGTHWIEVSNFKKDFKNYFANIEDKEDAINNAGYTFLFLRSLKEVDEYLEIFHNKI